MNAMTRLVKFVMTVALASTSGILPACGTMGGGGMHYLADPAISTAQPAST